MHELSTEVAIDKPLRLLAGPGGIAVHVLPLALALALTRTITRTRTLTLTSTLTPTLTLALSRCSPRRTTCYSAPAAPPVSRASLSSDWATRWATPTPTPTLRRGGPPLTLPLDEVG